MFKIRDGTEEDCAAIESMIKELAVYQDMPHEPGIDRNLLERDAFGEERLLKTLVVELEDTKQLIGYSLFYFKYSTYYGKSLYLEDIFVKSEYRQLGVGQALLTKVTKHAYLNSCHEVEWMCWDWNHNSISFYKKFGANTQTHNEKWISFVLNKQQIDRISQKDIDGQRIMFKIREAIKEDCIAVEAMVRELIAHNRTAVKELPKDPGYDVNMLEKDGFGEQRLLRIIVAESEDTKQLIGYSLYFFNYSKYYGKSLYMEDIFVKSQYRHLGVGQALLNEVAKQANLNSCSSVEWMCRQWNIKSIEFYERFGANKPTQMNDLIAFSLNKQQIQQISKDNHY